MKYSKSCLLLILTLLLHNYIKSFDLDIGFDLSKAKFEMEANRKTECAPSS